jgi:hypothetical protein
MEAIRREDEQVDRLQARVAVLEEQVLTLIVAVDAATRLRLSSEVIDPDVRIVGGKRVRRILEKGGLIRGYPELPSVD